MIRLPIPPPSPSCSPFFPFLRTLQADRIPAGSLEPVQRAYPALVTEDADERALFLLAHTAFLCHHVRRSQHVHV